MRRAFLILLLFAAMAAAQTAPDRYRVLPATPAYHDHAIMLLKHLSRIAQNYSWEREVKLARIRNTEGWAAYKRVLLRDYKKSLGLPFPERTPLHAETVKILERDGYRIENVIYQSMPGIWVTANLYVPRAGGGPWPGILFPCGHSRNGKAYHFYHAAALGLVKKGYVVLLYDPPGQGERYQYLGEDGSLLLPAPTREHSLLANPLFLLGKHLMTLRLWDGIRGIDYLVSRPEVDPDRIGCTGNSGGGTVTLYLTPLEERIKVAVPVGTVGSPDMELGTGGIADGEQNLPLLVPRGITHADLMMLAWPRPYRLIKESQGGVWRGTRVSFTQAHWLYTILGRPAKMSLVETEQPHGYYREMREAMYEWFGKWFYGRDDDRREPELRLEKEKDLLCAKSGQILNERGMAIWQWAAEQLKTTLPRPAVPANPDEQKVFQARWRREAKSLLRNPARKIRIRADEVGSVAGARRVTEKVVLYSEDDIYLPALFFKPDVRGKFSVVILADSAGKTADGGALAERLVAAGYGVFAVDLRGYGETRITERSNRDRQGGFEAQTLGVEAGVAYDGLRLGRSIFAMRIFDLRRVVDYLASRPEVDAARIALIGRNSCGTQVLYAAALDDRVAGVLVDRSLESFSELVRAKLYTWHFMDFLPRVLKYHDLPQVAGAVAPRPVWILNSLDAMKQPREVRKAKETYQWTTDCYRNAGAARNFSVARYTNSREYMAICLDWCRTVFGPPC